MFFAGMYICLNKILLVCLTIHFEVDPGTETGGADGIGDAIMDLINGAGEVITEELGKIVQFVFEAIGVLLKPTIAKFAGNAIDLAFSTYTNLMSSALSFSYYDETFSPLRDTVINTSESVIMPVAGLIVTYAFCYNIIQILVDRNNQVEIDWFVIAKECFKAACALLIVTHAFDIAQALIDVGNYLTNGITGSGAFSVTLTGNELMNEDAALSMEIGTMLLLILVAFLVALVGIVCAALIRFTIYTRMITIYLLIALAPIPLSTFLAGGWISQIGQAYIKTMLSYALQGFIMVLLANGMGTVLGGISNGLVVSMEPVAMIEHIIVVIALTITFQKSLSIAKSVMNSA